MRIKLDTSHSVSNSEAIAQIMAIEAQIFQSGSFDSEKNEIDSVLDLLKKGKMSPVKALELVKRLEQGRQNYH